MRIQCYIETGGLALGILTLLASYSTKTKELLNAQTICLFSDTNWSTVLSPHIVADMPNGFVRTFIYLFCLVYQFPLGLTEKSFKFFNSLVMKT